MNAAEILSAPLETVRAFIDEFARTADINNPAHVETLHAAKARITRDECRAHLRALRSGAAALGAAVVIAAAQPGRSDIPLQVPAPIPAPEVMPYDATAAEIEAADGITIEIVKMEASK